jgi:hypothetical protein
MLPVHFPPTGQGLIYSPEFIKKMRKNERNAEKDFAHPFGRATNLWVNAVYHPTPTLPSP